MKREGLVFGIAGTFFGLLIGWIIGSQYAGAGGPAPGIAQPATQQAGATPSAAPPIDTQRAADLERAANANPKDAVPRVELGNLYHDAKRYDLAIRWYEAALALEPKNVNVSTDLAVSYYYTNDVDRALTQLTHSLSIDPKHPKTLFNQGVVRAFGKGDLKGAGESWAKVIEVAPQSEEAQSAKQGLDGLAGGHAGAGAGTGTGAAGPAGAGRGGAGRL